MLKKIKLEIDETATFGALIHQARLERGWSLREAADHIGVDPIKLGKIETFEHSPPSTGPKVDAICRGLGIEGEDVEHLKILALRHHLKLLRDKFITRPNKRNKKRESTLNN